VSVVYVDSFPTVYWRPATVGKESRVRDDKTVAEGLRKRDPEVWAEVYEEYFPRIYRYVAARLRNQSEVEDLAEQVFLKALEASPSFKWKGAPVSAWLFRIARNQVIDYRRTDKAGKRAFLSEGIMSDSDDPETAAERNWELRRAIEAIEQLTRAQRDVIELRFAGELSTAEVAEILGKSRGAVKVLQHSALAALRKRLTVENDDER